MCGSSQATVKKYIEQNSMNEEDIKRIDKAEPIIRQWILNDRALPRRQRHTARRIYDRLIEEQGINTYMEAVNRMVKKIRAELAVREDIIDDEIVTPGSAQYGACRILYFNQEGKRKIGTLFCLCFPYSGAICAKLVTNEYPETVIQTLKEFFYEIGKVPYQISFTETTKIFKKHAISYDYPTHEVFYILKSHYHFNVRFIISQCSPMTSVENACRIVKKDYLKIKSRETITINSVTAFNNELNEFTAKRRLEKLAYGNVKQADLHKRDLEYMRDLPEKELPVFTESLMKTSLQNSLILDGQYKYFLSPRYMSTKIIVRKFSKSVGFYTMFNKHIVSLKRQDWNYSDSNVDWEGYLGYLIAKPNAIKNTSFLQMMPDKLQELFLCEDTKLISVYLSSAKTLNKHFKLEKIFKLLETAYLRKLQTKSEIMENVTRNEKN